MKSSTSKKLLIAAVTVATVVAPLVPKNVTLNINMAAAVKTEKPYTIVSTKCELQQSFLDDKGHQVCSYKCKDGDNITVSKTMFNNSMVCQRVIEEKVKKTSR